MNKALPFILFGGLALALGGLLAWSLFRPASASEGYVVVSRVQAVAPQYQAKPVRVDCPAGSKIFVPLCEQAGKFVSGGKAVTSTRMRCMPGSASYNVSGEIKGEGFAVRFDCNRTNQEALRSAAKQAFEQNTP